MASVCHSCFRRDGNWALPNTWFRVRLYSSLKTLKTKQMTISTRKTHFFHSIFSGLKNTTSRGWRMCVAFDGRQSIILNNVHVVDHSGKGNRATAKWQIQQVIRTPDSWQPDSAFPPGNGFCDRRGLEEADEVNSSCMAGTSVQTIERTTASPFNHYRQEKKLKDHDERTMTELKSSPARSETPSCHWDAFILVEESGQNQ